MQGCDLVLSSAWLGIVVRKRSPVPSEALTVESEGSGNNVKEAEDKEEYFF